MTRPLPARASRRRVLGGLTAAGTTVAVGALAGCQATPGRGGGTPSPQSSAAGPEEAPEAAEDPDARLVGRVVDDLTAALALVGGVARARRALATEVAPWQELHAAHLEALEAPARTRPLRLGAPAPALRARVRRDEATLQRRLATACVAAESGPLAALLATMSAAVAQQLAADADGGGA